MSVLYGCKLMVVKELDPDTGLPPEADGKVAMFETPQEAGINHQWITGQRQEVRGGDAVVATVEEDDELTGANITFRDAKMPGEALALLAGGTWDEVNKKYSAPRRGEKPAAVQIELYVARYAEGHNDQSQVIGYRKWTFYHAKGRVPDYTAQDRNYLVPQFTIKCTENAKADKPVYEWEDVDELPSAS